MAIKSICTIKLNSLASFAFMIDLIIPANMPLSRVIMSLIQLAEVRGVHDVELSHYMSVNEALQAQLAALHAERDGFTRAIAEMRSVTL